MGYVYLHIRFVYIADAISFMRNVVKWTRKIIDDVHFRPLKPQ
jgi:hypothetical protein